MTKKSCVLWVLVLFVFQGLLLMAADPTKEVPKPIQKLMKSADSELKDKKFDKAIEQYNEVLKLDAEFAPAYAGLGRALLGQQKNTEALTQLEKAVKLNPEAADVKLLYIKTLFDFVKAEETKNNIKGLIGYYEKFVEIPGIEKSHEKPYVDVLFRIGYLYSISKEFDKSNNYFLKIVEFPPAKTTYVKTLVQSLFQLGFNYSNLGKNKESMEYFLNMLKYPEVQVPEFNQIYITAHCLIGVSASQLKDYPKSNEYLTKFLELAANSPAHASLLPNANMLIGSNHVAVLKDESDKLKKENDKNYSAKMAEMAQKDKDAETYLLKAIQLNPNLEDAYSDLSNYYLFCDNTDKTIETAQKLVDMFPNSPQIEKYKSFLKKVKEIKDAKEKEKKAPTKPGKKK